MTQGKRRGKSRNLVKTNEGQANRNLEREKRTTGGCASALKKVVS